MSQIPDAISVVIPTYNRAHLIKESLQSVLDQTLQPYEIIVVDDFSTDNTEEVVKSINSPLIKYFKNERKKGANGARNTGILIAKGEYIAFHDSDDIWLCDKLKRQKEKLKERNVDLCFCSMISINENRKIKVPDFFIKDVSYELKLRSIISTQTIFIKSEFAKLKLFSEDIMRLQDWDFCLKIIDKAEFYHLNEFLVVQKINSESISKNNKYIESYLEIIEKHDFVIQNYLNIYYVINTSKNKLIKVLYKFLAKFRGFLN